MLEAALMALLVSALSVALRRHGLRADEAGAGPPQLRWTASLAGILALTATLVWLNAISGRSDGRLRMTVLDVGQGDAILVETPGGARMLIDGGPSGSLLLQALANELPPSARRLDLVVLTHAQDDHVTGLVSLFERYEVEQALMGPIAGETAAFREWRERIDEYGVTVHEAMAGEWAELGRGARLEVLGPLPGGVRGSSDRLNDNSVVLRLVVGDVSFLLTGDITAAAEGQILSAGGDIHSTVLKVAHHGSDGSSTEPFIEAVSPEVAVVSAGIDNTFGHPSPTTLLRLAGIPVMSTDSNGSIRFETDGRSLWVEFDRGNYRMVPPEAAGR
jgi:competence protein ComEC